MKQPLAFRLRPTNLNDIIGQKHLFGPDGVLRKAMESTQLFSMIFYGPPGTGKTTTALTMVTMLKRPYRLFNAVTGNKKELDQIFVEAKMSSGFVLIMDEVHRLNRDKQDHLLPYVEDGTITLIGATTSNPYYAINAAIRSRVHLFEFKPLSEIDCLQAITYALSAKEGLDGLYSIEDSAKHHIASACNGDLRFALNLLEISAMASKGTVITIDTVKQYARVANNASEDSGDGYYDLLSGFQKSIRGSDVDGALYYLARLIQAGDLDSIERRLLVIAYEDIGLANPACVARTISAIDVAKRVGFPEARIPLSVAVVDLAASPKSKTAYEALDRALQVVSENPGQIPAYLRLTPVGLNEEDKYPYDQPSIWPRLAYLPEHIKDTHFYIPNKASPYEKIVGENVEKLRQFKRSYHVKALKKGGR